MNVAHLTAEELLGYLYLQNNLSPTEKALMARLQEALDKLAALKV